MSKTWQNQFFASVIGRMWAERGYTVVIQGTRGRFGSTGPYDPLRHEKADGEATLQLGSLNNPGLMAAWECGADPISATRNGP